MNEKQLLYNLICNNTNVWVKKVHKTGKKNVKILSDLLSDHIRSRPTFKLYSVICLHILSYQTDNSQEQTFLFTSRMPENIPT